MPEERYTNSYTIADFSLPRTFTTYRCTLISISWITIAVGEKQQIHSLETNFFNDKEFVITQPSTIDAETPLREETQHS